MHLSLFPALFERPLKVSFIEQEKGEQIELLLRRHFVTNIPWLFNTLIFLFVPTIVSWILPFVLPGILVPTEVQGMLLVTWYLLVVAYVIEKFLYWYFNIYILTNKNLVDINFHNINNRNVVEITLDKIESAKYVTKGFLSSFFNFGDIIIETAAENQRIEFHYVPQPAFVADRIQDIKEIYLSSGGGSGGR